MEDELDPSLFEEQFDDEDFEDLDFDEEELEEIEDFIVDFDDIEPEDNSQQA